MNIALSFYEIFARLVPGIFYLFALGQLSLILGLSYIDLKVINNLGLIPSIGLAIASYILGTVLYPVSIVWHRLFKPKNAPESAFIEFQKRNLNWRFEFESKDWRVLFAWLRKENHELANSIEKSNAYYIMLESISFGIILLAVNQVVLFFIRETYLNILYCGFLIVFSLLAAREGRFFQLRFYHLIFETALSYELKMDGLVKRNNAQVVYKTKKKKT